MIVSDLTDSITGAMRQAGSYAAEFVNPALKLGVTGLARSGKTVFITSLIHNLVNQGRLPFFEAAAQGRIRRAFLEPQPNDQVPRFDYERHVAELAGKPPNWPQSTRRISQFRLTIEYEPEGLIKRSLGYHHLHIDIIDYPGEWLLDLPLLQLSFEEWSRNSWALSMEPGRRRLAKDWHEFARALDIQSRQDELTAVKAAELFTAYLKNCRADEHALSTVPPGRFLMPGDLAGSPALTFSPLDLPKNDRAKPDSLWAMMARRYEAYKKHVVKPFFRDHFSRLDRQIVLVDTLRALNAGPEAVRDLERALADILNCFRPGRHSWLASILHKRIDRIVFAATKADHLHHTSHDRLEAILRGMTTKAIERAQFAGAKVEVTALAALRATREGIRKQHGEELPCIIGHPLPGERIGDTIFDGKGEAAIFPGDLPDNPDEIFKPASPEPDANMSELSFIRFRPPDLTDPGAALPHIRLDRAIDFLIGDRLK